MASSPPPYIGRFAPSPTGPLHFGSLLSALASFLDARAHQGKWLVRIEDIDPPREVPGATQHILHTLEAYGLEWDEKVMYQSRRTEIYKAASDSLIKLSKAYYCTCNRQQIKAMGGVYNGHCQRHPPSNGSKATRVRFDSLDHHSILFNDLIQGRQPPITADTLSDFIIYRKDGLPAYQLAVTIDDIEQKITHVIRGHDLLSSTARQIFLNHHLNNDSSNHFPGQFPIYGHIPVATNAINQKLSKQNHAPSLEQHPIATQLYHALCFLNQSPPKTLALELPPIILDWAIEHWKLSAIPSINAIQHLI